MRKALIIGIDDYSHSPLNNAVSDAMNIASLLATNDDGSKNFHCKTLLSSEVKITEKLLRSSIRNHFKYEADVALFYFAGHGLGNEYGGYLIPQDTTHHDEGFAFSELLSLANNSSIKEILILLDCCSSGFIGNTEIIGDDKAILRKGVSILASSEYNQPSLETSGGGVFTNLLCNALRGEAADLLGNVTVASIYNHADILLGPWEQRPILKAHLSSLVTLRTCTPKVPFKELKKINHFFPKINYHFPLDPSFEPKSDPKNTHNESIFATLQVYRAVNLVEPVGEQHMYYAAINSKACRLTKLGRFYWTIVSKKKI